MGKTTKDRLVIKQKLYIILMLLFCLCITACGKQADTDQGIEDVEESKVIKDETVTENGVREYGEITEKATEKNEVWQS